MKNIHIIYKITFALLIILVTVCLVQSIKIYRCFKKGNFYIQPWQKIIPDAPFKVLVAGDSTAVGTGLSDNAQSTAGLLSHDYPQFDVENYSRNGLRLKGLANILGTIQDKKFDLAILQIGANDILFFTPLDQISADHRRVLDLTRHIAKRVIILHSGDIGSSPLFIWPLSWVYTWRSLKVREIYAQRQDDRVSYLDLYALNKGQDYTGCYGRDSLHLNEKGYAIWYAFIKNQLQQLHWL